MNVRLELNCATSAGDCTEVITQSAISHSGVGRPAAGQAHLQGAARGIPSGASRGATPDFLDPPPPPSSHLPPPSMRILCLLALLALSAAEQIVNTKDWRTTKVAIDSKSFTKIVDAEGRETSFYIKRLAPSKEDWVHDCYEVRLENTG
jgi:hypothetical protein